MNNEKKLINSVELDFVFSLVLSLIIFIILSYINFNPVNDDIVSTFITFFGALLGFTITALTILFMFNPKDNEILARIKEVGLYNQIFDRFISTIKVLLASSIILIIILVFLNIIASKYTYLIPYSLFVFLVVVFLSFFRIYRCVSLLADICKILK